LNHRDTETQRRREAGRIAAGWEASGTSSDRAQGRMRLLSGHLKILARELRDSGILVPLVPNLLNVIHRRRKLLFFIDIIARTPCDT
jgi:hypothetical protein